MNLPLKVYVDTNILNDIAPKGQVWSKTKWSNYLLKLSEKGIIEVWASPGNCLEIAINPDLKHRNNMALALNTLTRGQRMMPVYETFVIEDFLNHIEAIWPNVVYYQPLNKIKRLSQQNYIALLGQMAALEDYDCKAGFSGIIKPKVITQIIHADLFESPKAKLAARLEQLRDKNLPRENLFGNYEQMSIEELQILEKNLRGKKYKVDKSAVAFLKKNKKDFITGYSKEELRFAIDQVFEYFDDVLFSMDFIHICKNWNLKNDKNVRPLHPNLVTNFTNNPSREDIVDLLIALQERFYKNLGIPQMYYTIVVNELEKALNVGEIPTGGLILDGHHAISALNVDYFLCRDARLLATIKSIYKSAPDGANREAMDNLKEFERKINSKLNDQIK